MVDMDAELEVALQQTFGRFGIDEIIFGTPDIDHSEIENFIAHFGVKGMHWGVRKDDYPGATRKTNRDARKDAQEFARAKMFYGEGAGTRRKLIKATVQSKSKNNPTYQKAFDHHLANQDLGRHGDKARAERRRKDTSAKVGKTARGVNRIINGQFAAPLGALAIASAFTYARASGLDQRIASAGAEFIRRHFS